MALQSHGGQLRSQSSFLAQVWIKTTALFYFSVVCVIMQKLFSFAACVPQRSKSFQPILCKLSVLESIWKSSQLKTWSRIYSTTQVDKGPAETIPQTDPKKDPKIETSTQDSKDVGTENIPAGDDPKKSDMAQKLKDTVSKGNGLSSKLINFDRHLQNQEKFTKVILYKKHKFFK